MTINTLQDIRIAILAADGFEQAELLEPKRVLDSAGAATFVISPSGEKIKGWNNEEWEIKLSVDIPLTSANAEDFHALLLPGGVMNADFLRRNQNAVQFVKHFIEAGKPVAAICHAPWTLLEAGGVRGCTMTSWPSLKTDLENAGANWVDKNVVCDGVLIASRKPDDIPAFDREMIRLFAEVRDHTTEMRRS
jgi:protease I